MQPQLPSSTRDTADQTVAAATPHWHLWQTSAKPINTGSAAMPPPLLALHGFAGEGSDFRWLAAAHAAQFTLYAPDFTGHGQSDSPQTPEPYRIGPTLRALHATLNSLQPQAHTQPQTIQPILLGYSMGGRVALRYLARYGTGGIRAMVLIGASAGLSDPAERRARRNSDATLAAFIEKEGTAAFVEHWNSVPLIASQRSSPFFPQLQQQRLRNKPHGLANSLRGIGTGSLAALSQAQLQSINIPCLIVSGENDKKFTLIGQDLAAALPQAEHAVIPNCGHAAHLEAPDTFSQILNSWLSKLNT